MTTEGPIQVAASADDAFEFINGAGFTSVGIQINIVDSVTANKSTNGGFRFNAVNIPTGATIDAVDFELFIITFGSLDANVAANLVVDAADFSSDPDVTTRIASAATVANAQWVTGSIFPSGVFISSSTDNLDLNAIIQEIIDQGGPWVDGNDLVMLVEGNADGGRRGEETAVVRAYDGTPAEAAKLTVDYTGGGGGPAVLASRRLLSGTGR